MKQKKNKLKVKKKLLLIVSILILSVLIILSLFVYIKYTEYQEEKRYKEKLVDIQEKYNTYVLTNKESNLYNEKDEVLGKVSSNVYLELEEIDEAYNKEYFKIKDSNMYIKYTDIKKTEEQIIENTRYKNYISNRSS